MTIAALILILAAAVIHATWNLLNKQASGHATFTWLVALLSAVFYAPVTITIIEIWQLKIGFVEVGMMAGSAAPVRCSRPLRRFSFSANGHRRSPSPARC